MLNLGPRILEARTAKRFSQTELATMVGVKTAMVSLYENNKRTPSLLVFLKMCSALEVDLAYMIGRGPRRKPCLECNGQGWVIDY